MLYSPTTPVNMTKYEYNTQTWTSSIKPVKTILRFYGFKPTALECHWIGQHHHLSIMYIHLRERKGIMYVDFSKAAAIKQVMNPLQPPPPHKNPSCIVHLVDNPLIAPSLINHDHAPLYNFYKKIFVRAIQLQIVRYCPQKVKVQSCVSMLSML